MAGRPQAGDPSFRCSVCWRKIVNRVGGRRLCKTLECFGMLCKNGKVHHFTWALGYMRRTLEGRPIEGGDKKRKYGK